MASAFLPTTTTTTRNTLGVSPVGPSLCVPSLNESSIHASKPPPPKPVWESETEDEEVKFSCVGGGRYTYGADFSDIESAGEDEGENCASEESDAEADAPDECTGVVTFVTAQPTISTQPSLLRPKAYSPSRSSPAASLSSSSTRNVSMVRHRQRDSSNERDSSSVGARGVPCTLFSSAMSEEAADDCEDEEVADGDDEDSEDDESEEDDVSSDDETDEPATSRIDFHAGGVSNANYCEPNGGVEEEPAGNGVTWDEPEEPENDLELASILGSSGDSSFDVEDESEFPTDFIVGVMQDRNIEATANVPKTKRVLSYTTLTALNVEAGHDDDSPKRQKAIDSPPQLPLLRLGPAATSMLPLLSVRSLREIREESPILSSSDEEELDERLRDELDKLGPERGENDGEAEMHHIRNGDSNTPVPLLTPPQSPLTIALEQGTSTTVCEWPSNMAVDSAMRTAAEMETMTVRVMSALSLTGLDDEGEGSDSYDFNKVACSDDASLLPVTTLRESSSPETTTTATPSEAIDLNATTLTPLIRGIYVGWD
jgi:hypothetical protein